MYKRCIDTQENVLIFEISVLKLSLNCHYIYYPLTSGQWLARPFTSPLSYKWLLKHHASSVSQMSTNYKWLHLRYLKP